MKKDQLNKQNKHQLKDQLKHWKHVLNSYEMENAYLKKLNALVQNKEKSPNKTKRK